MNRINEIKALIAKARERTQEASKELTLARGELSVASALLTALEEEFPENVNDENGGKDDDGEDSLSVRGEDVHD